MRSNRLIGFALALAAAGTAQAAAAQQQGPPQGHEQHARGGHGPFQRLFQGVTLTAQQQEQVRAIFEQGRPNGAERRGPDGARGERGRRGGHGDHGARGRGGERREPTAEQRQQMEQRRAEMERRHTEMLARVRAILTPQQRAQFDRNVAQMEAQRREHGDRWNRGPRGDSARTLPARS